MFRKNVLGQFSFDWNSHGVNFRPSKIVNSRTSNSARYPCLLTPLGQRFRFTVDGYQSVFASIVSLLLISCPTTIIRAVVAAIINTFECVAKWPFWSWPHVCKKVIKRVYPAVTYFDSATTVIFELCVFFSITTVAHSKPGFMFCCITHSVRTINSEVIASGLSHGGYLTHSFPLFAAARVALPRVKGAWIDYLFGATIASDYNSTFTSRAFNSRNFSDNQKFSELFTDEHLARFSHGENYSKSTR